MRLSRRCVLTGDAKGQPGRLGGELSAAGAQRTAPGQREPGREGDPQLWAGGQGRPGCARPARHVDLAVPDPGTGRDRGGRRWRARRRGRGAGLAASGRGVDAGPAVGAPRDRRGDPPGRHRAAPGRRRGRAGGVRARCAAGVRTGLETGRDRLGGRAGRDRPLPGVHSRRRVRRDGLPARRLGRDRRRGVLLGRAPAQPGSGHRVRGHDQHLLGARDRRRDRRVGPGPGRRRDHQPHRGRGAGVRALQGPPRRPAAGGDRDGGHPRRGAGAVLELPRRHRRHRDHPHRQGRPGRVGAAPAGVGGRPRVRLRREPGLPDPRWRALHPRREAAAPQRRGRCRARPTGPLPHRGRPPAGQGRSRWPPAARGTATAVPAPNGS